MCINRHTHTVFLKDELLRDFRDLWLLVLRRPYMSTVAPWTGSFRKDPLPTASLWCLVHQLGDLTLVQML